MKRRNLSGIFATALIAVTIFTLASCSQDDEYYEDGLFTRADEMMTRSEGGQGGYTPNPYAPCIIGDIDIPFLLKENIVNSQGNLVLDSLVIDSTVSFYVELDTAGYYRSNWTTVGIDWANTRSEDPDAALRSIACLGKGRVKLRFTYNYDIYMACTDTVITINVRD
jgi:hypothetical protein